MTDGVASTGDAVKTTGDADTSTGDIVGDWVWGDGVGAARSAAGRDHARERVGSAI